jgi:hypothetical protein
MDSKDKVLLSAMEYFLSRKKYIDRYVEGEHKWFGDCNEEYTPFNNRPWYLEDNKCFKTHTTGLKRTHGSKISAGA